MTRQVLCFFFLSCRYLRTINFIKENVWKGKCRVTERENGRVGFSHFCDTNNYILSDSTRGLENAMRSSASAFQEKYGTDGSRGWSCRMGVDRLTSSSIDAFATTSSDSQNQFRNTDYYYFCFFGSSKILFSKWITDEFLRLLLVNELKFLLKSINERCNNFLLSSTNFLSRFFPRL